MDWVILVMIFGLHIQNIMTSRALDDIERQLKELK